MKNSRTTNSSRNLLFGLAEKAITIIFPFITRTIIIYKLGNEYLGLSTLFTSILSILTISELGLGAAITSCLYEPVSKDDENTINVYLGYIRRVYKFTGAFIILVGVCLMPFLKLLIKGSYPSDINLYYLYFIYLLNASLSYLFFAYKESLYTAYQRKDRINKASIVSELIKYIIQIIVLLLYRNYYLFVIALLISTIIKTLIIGYSSKIDYPNCKATKKGDKEILRKIKAKTKYIFINTTFSKLVIATDNIVISSSIGVLVLGKYGNYSYVSSSILGLILIVFNSFASSIGNALVMENDEKNREIYDVILFLSSWLITWCTLCMLSLFQPFVELWAGESNLLPTFSVILICICFYANSNSQLYCIAYVDVMGLWDKIMPYRIVASICNLVLDLILIKPFGINGVLLATAFSYLIISLPSHMFVTYKYIFNERMMVGIKKHIENLITTCVLCIIMFILTNSITITGFLGLAIKLTICTLIPNVLFFIVNKNKPEFKLLLKYISVLFSKG